MVFKGRKAEWAKKIHKMSLQPYVHQRFENRLGEREKGLKGMFDLGWYLSE